MILCIRHYKTCIKHYRMCLGPPCLAYASLQTNADLFLVRPAIDIVAIHLKLAHTCATHPKANPDSTRRAKLQTNIHKFDNVPTFAQQLHIPDIVYTFDKSPHEPDIV